MSMIMCALKTVEEAKNPHGLVKKVCVRCDRVIYSKPGRPTIIACDVQDGMKKPKPAQPAPESELTLEYNTIVDMPKDPMSLAYRYWEARKKWKEVGKPLRKPEEMEYIYDNFCANGCPHFNGNGCDICGCRINKTRYTLNKLAWATEKCPDEPPRWGENTKSPQAKLEPVIPEPEPVDEEALRVAQQENKNKGGTPDVIPPHMSPPPIKQIKGCCD